MGEIFHITTRNGWADAQIDGHYRADSLETEGFIHCSGDDQILGPANERYRGQTDLVLLRIDTDRLTSRLVVEDSYGHGAFPHVYGPLNLEAVTGVVDFPPNEDGTFSLPEL